MLKFREEPLWISRQMGHANVSETLETYAKYIPSMNPDAGMGAYAAIMATKKGRDQATLFAKYLVLLPTGKGSNPSAGTKFKM